ncbi:unnamed protein product [Caenorhabditis brenneri]
MVFHTEFHKWNLLPEELKLECIKHVNLKTRFLLRETSRTERRLVNSQRFYLRQFYINNRSRKCGIHINFEIYEKSLDGELIGVEFTEEEMIPTAVSFISFILEKANVTSFECYDNRGEFSKNCYFESNLSGGMLESLRFLGEISELRIRNFDGEVTPHMLPMFEKCPPNTVEKIQIFYKSQDVFPINKFLKYPMVDSVKNWNLYTPKSPDLGQTIGRKWIQLDVEVGSEYTFNKVKNDDMESFAIAFPECKLVQKTEKLIRIETRNPNKHLLLIISKDTMNNSIRWRQWTLLMIPKEFPESKYDLIGCYWDFDEILAMD